MNSRHVSIDLRSDTLSQPTPGMRAAMAAAEVGDDAYGEDPTVRDLERYCADLLGKEAALFCSTGTMSNQLAIRVHTRPGDELITDASHHIAYFESAPTAELGRVTVNAVRAPGGVLTGAILRQAVDAKPRGPLYSAPKLVCAENTVANHGGRVVAPALLWDLRDTADRLGLAVHLDGARLANAAVAGGASMAEYAAAADTVSICFAKGLGAPFGSVLAGPADAIELARRYRKWFGGALHQAGFLAAAARYALDHQLERLAEDHANAKLLACLLAGHAQLHVDPPAVQTNIVIINVAPGREHEMARLAAGLGVRILPWCPGQVRATTHLGVSEGDIVEAAARLAEAGDRLGRPHHTPTGRRVAAGVAGTPAATSSAGRPAA